MEVQKEQESVTDWTLKLWEACGSPKGARKRDGLDVKAAGKQAVNPVCRSGQAEIYQ